MSPIKPNYQRYNYFLLLLVEAGLQLMGEIISQLYFFVQVLVFCLFVCFLCDGKESPAQDSYWIPTYIFKMGLDS